MVNLARYCKAYYRADLDKFPGFHTAARPAVAESTANAADSPNGEVVFLHDDFLVTAGISRNDGVVFEGGGPEWETYCREALGLEAPAWCANGGLKTEAGAPA